MVVLKKKINLGILGCGEIGKEYIKQLSLLSYYSLIAVCVKSLESSQKIKKMIPNIRVYKDKNQLFSDEEIDAIIICTPHSQHTSDAINALYHKKHILIEKPIATNLEELRLLLNISKDNNEVSVTALPHNNFEIFELCTDIIKNNYIGKITKIDSYMDVPGPPRSNWYYSREAIGGASLDTFPYVVSRALCLLQKDIVRAYGFNNQVLNYRRCLDGKDIKPQVDDNITILAELETGQQLLLRSNWNVSFPQDFLIIYGRQGTIKIDCWKHQIKLYTNREYYGNYKLQIGNCYIIESKKKNPEYMKLELFYNNIIYRKSNLEEVAHFMELILYCLKQNGTLEINKGFYSNSSLEEYLVFNQDYL